MALTALGYLKSVEVLPTQANWSGTVSGDPQYGVGQTFVANFDSITEVSLFSGSPGVGQNYELRVRDAETDELIAHQYNVAPAGDHKWLRFLSIIPDGKFVRGREYLVKFTRPNDSINWYKDIFNKYAYGHMVGGFADGQPPPQSGDDLCLRIYGKARVGDEFAVHSNIVLDRGVADSANWLACIDKQKEVGVRHDKIGYGYWGNVQPDSANQWNWGWMDYLMTRFSLDSIQPIMSFRGTPAWACCARRRDGTPDGIPVGLYQGVKSGDSINPNNYYAKYIYDFVRRYGPIGHAFNGSLSGTFWLQTGSSPHYVPIVLFEGYPGKRGTLPYFIDSLRPSAMLGTCQG